MYRDSSNRRNNVVQQNFSFSFCSNQVLRPGKIHQNIKTFIDKLSLWNYIGVEILIRCAASVQLWLEAALSNSSLAQCNRDMVAKTAQQDQSEF